MADIEIFTLVNTKTEVTDAIAVESDRAIAAEALKLDTSEVGGDNGIPQMSGGTIQASDIAWASNADATEGTSAVLSMSPLRTQEQFIANLQERVGLVSVSTGATQTNTFDEIHSKCTYFNTTDISTNGHFTVDGTNQEITVNQDGIYKVSGVLNVGTDNVMEVEFQAHVNGSPIGVTMAMTGRGIGKPVGVPYTAVLQLTSGDVFTIYGGAGSDGTEVLITASSVSLEKTVHG